MKKWIWKHKWIITSIIVFTVGISMLIGSTFYWVEYDKEHNEQGGYLSGVNLSKADRDFRYNFQQVSFTVWFIGMGMVMLTSIPYTIDKAINQGLKEK